MADKQQASLKRLAKKLSALRATLSKDERVLLDRIVLGVQQEVSPHMISAGAEQSRKRATTTGKATPTRNRYTTGGAAKEVAGHALVPAGSVMGKQKAAVSSANEVAVHSMTMTGSATLGKQKAATSSANEVSIHGMVPAKAATSSANSAAVPGANLAAANAALLQFDPTTGGYQIANAATL